MILDMEILVAKCRDGRLGPVAVEFHRPFTTFKPKFYQ
jgi:replicative DNA helicase